MYLLSVSGKTITRLSLRCSNLTEDILSYLTKGDNKQINHIMKLKGRDHMTLQESEEKLSELNAEIDRLLREREAVLKEWNDAFNTENSEHITCVDENIGDSHELYLVNGESKMQVCYFNNFDMEGSIEKFYRRIDNSMCIHNVANGRNNTPEYQRNLVYAKAIEIRESVQAEKPV